MTNRRLKKPVLYGLCGGALLGVMGIAFVIESALSPVQFKENDPSGYVSKTIFEQELPVVATEATIIRPYGDPEIKIVKGFYDYQGDENSQKNALIYSENTYMQSSGIAYGGKDNFDVLSILDGTVIDVKEDKLLGNIVQIQHQNDLISVYQSLSEVAVKKDDTVKQGQIIGKSGLSNISKDLNSHLHFELMHKGQIVNPENYYDKKMNELEG